LKPPVDFIEAPPFPSGERWINTAPLVMEELRGRVVVLEFWDFCRPNSLRTLPYLREWHSRYGDRGLVVVSVHAPGFRASADEDAVRAAVARLDIQHPVLLDTDFALWHEYENAGWPGRYVWGADGMLADYHYGEGAYADCEEVIGSLLGIEVDPLAPLRAEDARGASLVVPSEDRLSEPFDGPYEAGEAWAVLDGSGAVRANGRELAVEHPGAYLLVAHEHHTAAELQLELGAGVRCDGVCFTPGLAR